MKLSGRTILIVDDKAGDCFLMGRALDRTGFGLTIHFVTHAEEAVAYLNGHGVYAERLLFPYPSLIIADLGMHGGDGFSVLVQLRQNPAPQVVPVLVFSTSDDPNQMRRAYDLGATLYCAKRQNSVDLLPIVSNLFDHCPTGDSSLHRSAGDREIDSAPLGLRILKKGALL